MTSQDAGRASQHPKDEENPEMTPGRDVEREIMNPAVAAVFDTYDREVRSALLGLRRLIIDTADETAGVGILEETLKWGQPSYLTSQTRSGSTIRLGPTQAGSENDYAMYFVCTTNLVETSKDMFGDALRYERNRALLFSIGSQTSVEELRLCIMMALTYHLAKN